MTSCMIPRDIKILGNLKDLVGIKWRHKNSLFTPVKIMSINYDVTDYITAGEREGGDRFWIHGDICYRKNVTQNQCESLIETCLGDIAEEHRPTSASSLMPAKSKLFNMPQHL